MTDFMEEVELMWRGEVPISVVMKKKKSSIATSCVSQFLSHLITVLVVKHRTDRYQSGG